MLDFHVLSFVQFFFLLQAFNLLCVVNDEELNRNLVQYLNECVLSIVFVCLQAERLEQPEVEVPSLVMLPFFLFFFSPTIIILFSIRLAHSQIAASLLLLLFLTVMVVEEVSHAT